MNFIKSNISYVIIGILLVLIFFNTCSGDKRVDDSIPVKTDTITIIKKIKGETVKVTDTVFYPEIEYRTDPKLMLEINKLKTDKEKLEKALSYLRTRVYDTTYTFNTGKVRVKDSIQGYLIGRTLDFKMNDTETKETMIKQTFHKYPKFAISVGLTGQVEVDTDLFTGIPNTNPIRKPTLGGEIGFRNKAGYQLEFGYNFREEVEISLKKDIFVFY